MANVVYMIMKFGREIEVTVQNGSRNDGLRMKEIFPDLAGRGDDETCPKT